MNVDFLSTDKDWRDQKTTYWFELTGHDDGSGYDFDGDKYGVVESATKTTIVDCDNSPLTPNRCVAVERYTIVTDVIARDFQEGGANNGDVWLGRYNRRVCIPTRGPTGGAQMNDLGLPYGSHKRAAEGSSRDCTQEFRSAKEQKG